MAMGERFRTAEVGQPEVSLRLRRFVQYFIRKNLYAWQLMSAIKRAAHGEGCGASVPW